MNRLRGKSGDTDRDILGAFRPGGAVLDPFPFSDDERLSGFYVDGFFFRLHPEHAMEYHGSSMTFGLFPWALITAAALICLITFSP